jgi:hypothetical protein
MTDDGFCKDCGEFYDFGNGLKPSDVPDKSKNDLITKLAALVMHCHFYSGSKDCGIDRMKPELRDLYMKVLRGELN